ncbi:MAG: anti-sigma factor [Gemmatimonadaceae bacterium]
MTTTWQETAAAYALDALDGAERDEFEALLTRSDEAQRDVAELKEVVSLLAYAAPIAVPPPSLRERVLLEARQVRPIAVARRHNANRLGVLAPYFALAASIVGIVLLGGRYMAERDARSTLAATTDTLRQALASRDEIINALLAPEVETLKLSATDRPPAARMYWNRTTGQVILAAFQLPPAREGRTYQLWGIARGGAPVSLGIFNTLPSGEARYVASAPAGLTIAVGAVTEEPAGGSPQPTSTPFLVGQVN